MFSLIISHRVAGTFALSAVWKVHSALNRFYSDGSDFVCTEVTFTFLDCWELHKFLGVQCPEMLCHGMGDSPLSRRIWGIWTTASFVCGSWEAWVGCWNIGTPGTFSLKKNFFLIKRDFSPEVWLIYNCVSFRCISRWLIINIYGFFPIIY